MLGLVALSEVILLDLR